MVWWRAVLVQCDIIGVVVLIVKQLSWPMKIFLTWLRQKVLKSDSLLVTFADSSDIFLEVTASLRDTVVISPLSCYWLVNSTRVKIQVCSNESNLQSSHLGLLLWRCRAYGLWVNRLVKVRKDHVLALTAQFCCHKHGSNTSRHSPKKPAFTSWNKKPAEASKRSPTASRLAAALAVVLNISGFVATNTTWPSHHLRLLLVIG